MSRVLVVNAGSSSLKHQLREDGAVLARGVVERIGSPQVPDHAAALSAALADLEAGPGLAGLVGVGHRVVHGGTAFTAPALVDDAVEAGIEALSSLAPLHNPPQLAGVRALRRLLPSVPQVAVFDTAFHATIPPEAATYAIPPELAARHGVRRYGFHGTSHRHVTHRAAAVLGVPVGAVRLVTCHIGNGASVTAVRDGLSVDTSMGLTPLEGLVMGTRSGDLDPAVVFHLVREAGMDVADVDDLLNHRSGLRGLAGESDVRAVRRRADAGDERARLALDVYAHRLLKYVGAYLAVVPGVQALVFTAGVGENDARLREAVCSRLEHLGVRLDPAANAAATGPREPVAVDDGTGPVRVLVVPTDEEAEIASQVLDLVGERPGTVPETGPGTGPGTGAP
ncbi:acetate/propionate family kinase [Quadrisphaera sp. DSM 44207]|uniref:acetate/propionate family kinase n=1 Tax=Quadrisphaera sp. DSM 44207 TaxID=1881057 RepID=UPI00088986D6|nr:acetate kinase [Quadrisphaera sp. DSM 44207]SDQ04000.1 acetate kinase [Quadrisphaera sp. DSM 44207]